MTNVLDVINKEMEQKKLRSYSYVQSGKTSRNTSELRPKLFLLFIEFIYLFYISTTVSSPPIPFLYLPSVYSSSVFVQKGAGFPWVSAFQVAIRLSSSSFIKVGQPTHYEQVPESQPKPQGQTLFPQVNQATNCHIYVEGLGRSHSGSLVDSSDSVSWYEPTQLVSVGSFMMILTSWLVQSLLPFNRIPEAQSSA